MKKKELLIFDMDGTLYDLKDVVNSNYEMQISFLVEKTGRNREAVVASLEENHIYPVMKKDSKSATEFFSREGYDMQEWTNYRESRFNVSAIDVTKAVDNDCIGRLAAQFKLVLLSSNSLKNIKRVLSHIGISSSHFSTIVCSDTFAKDIQFCKRAAMKDISRAYGVPFKDMVSIGDRYMTDIQPILELGGCGILLVSPSSMKRVQEDLICGKLKSCKEYEFYASFR